MSLKFIDSPDEGCLRSVGDPPHGIVAFSGDRVRGFALVVNSSYQPTADDPGVRIIEDATDAVIDTEEAVAALANVDDGDKLWRLVSLGAQHGAALAIAEADFDFARQAIDGAEEVARALVDRFRE